MQEKKTKKAMSDKEKAKRLGMSLEEFQAMRTVYAEIDLMMSAAHWARNMSKDAMDHLYPFKEKNNNLYSALNIAFNMMKSMDKLFGEEDAAEEDLFSDGYPDIHAEYIPGKENG